MNYWDRYNQKMKKDYDLLPQLLNIVEEYIPNEKIPSLPIEINGAIYGIGFSYDEDKDDRILVAIHKYFRGRNILAVREHEGGVDIYYSKIPISNMPEIELCGDIWAPEEYVPHNGDWVELSKIEQILEAIPHKRIGK